MTSVHVRRLQSRTTRTAARLVAYAAQHNLTVADLAAVKLPWYAITNRADEPAEPATVFIFDEIGGSFGVDAEQFARDLVEITAPEIRVRINSPGGSLFDGIAIYNALNHHPARITVYIDSLAASAASVIAMAGDEIVMMPGSQMMIHDASALEEGDAADHAKMSTFLDRQSDNVADLYRQRAGGDGTEWRDLMLAETWMFAREAVAFGLADRVEPAPQPDLDPALGDLMARAHDLSLYGYRHTGRTNAPPPARRHTVTVRAARTHPSEDPMPAPRTRASSDAERRDAARARLDATTSRPGTAATAKRKAPSGLSAARVASFPARLRAEKVVHNGQERFHVFGHASVVDTPYEMWDTFGPYMEIIDAGAFTKTLSEDPDVAFLVNHRGVTMARTTSGSLQLGMDEIGLKVDAWLNPKRQDVSDLVVAIEDANVTEMSFAFLLADGGGMWSADFQTFRVTEADINRGDVSAVNYGANPYTDVAARSREVLADLDHLPAGAARAALARLQTRIGTVDTVEAALHTPPAPAVTAVTEPAAPTGRSIAHIEALLID